VFSLSLPYWNHEPSEKAAFERMLLTDDPSIEHQAILLHLSAEGILPTWVVNVLGLYLDMEPGILSYVFSKGLQKRFGAGEKDTGLADWIHRENFIEVGADSLLLLEAVPGIRPQTG
jgi:hypothetical protein